MTKILLNGCLGKMGKMVTSSIKKRPKASICAGVDKASIEIDDYKIYTDIFKVLEAFDVILDFSSPACLESLLNFSVKNEKPLVICTTGYSSQDILKIHEASKSIPIFMSYNMSVGINIINNILKQYSKLLYKNYDIEIIEKHHKNKADAPSGTAKMLADTIKNSINEDTEFVYGREGNKKRERKELGIHAIRGGTITGEHEIIFAGENERISISHSAESREIFALSAIDSCIFISHKEKGLYNMDDLLKDNLSSL